MEALDRANRPMASTSGEIDRSPPGVKYSSTPFGTAVTRSGRKPSSSSSSRVDADGVTVAPRR